MYPSPICHRMSRPVSPVTAPGRRLLLTTAQARINLKSIKTGPRKHDTLETLPIPRPSAPFLLDAKTRRPTLSSLLRLCPDAVTAQQFSQIGQVDVAVTVDVAILVSDAPGIAVMTEQLGQVGDVNVAVVIEIARNLLFGRCVEDKT